MAKLAGLTHKNIKNNDHRSPAKTQSETNKRSIGCYVDENGEILVSFETGVKGVPLKSLIPEKDRGDAFDAFKISDYFALAGLVLVSQQDFLDVTSGPAFKPATVDTPVKTSFPIDLDHLQLRRSDGAMDPERTAALFEVVQAYWVAPPKAMAVEPGLVAGLWRRGMRAADTIRCIRASTGKDGKLIKASGRGHNIMTTVVDAYLASQGRSKDAAIGQDEMTELIDRWFMATRSAAPGSAEIQNAVLHWSDYRRLGLVDEAGAAQTDQVQRIADKVFMGETPFQFNEVSAWVDQYHPPKAMRARQSPQAARTLLKKKRKQGRLNRKRGRS